MQDEGGLDGKKVVKAQVELKAEFWQAALVDWPISEDLMGRLV